MPDPIEQFADLTGKAEVEEAKYGPRSALGFRMFAREARELLDALRRLERERDEAVEKAKEVTK